MPGQGGLDRSQVAVLAPSSTRGQCPDRFGTVPLTTELESWNARRGVLISSWRRFKGLQADAVVIIETPTYGGKRSDTDRYVARSRAKHRLTVIEAQEQ